jgi:L-aspartate semialdehyde sulfurtransferase ferredoxin
MITKRLILKFPEKIVTKPITYRLVKDFDLQFNILRAEITTDIEGRILIEVKGEKNKIEEGIKYLTGEGITIQDASKDIVVDRESCMNCGICPSFCPTHALAIEPRKHELAFDRNKCILCGFCENSCPVNAIRLKI